ncbi:hypothetical protein SRHO_G00276740 [Serrasalmus rhombeus]
MCGQFFWCTCRQESRQQLSVRPLELSSALNAASQPACLCLYRLEWKWGRRAWHGAPLAFHPPNHTCERRERDCKARHSFSYLTVVGTHSHVTGGEKEAGRP